MNLNKNSKKHLILLFLAGNAIYSQEAIDVNQVMATHKIESYKISIPGDNSERNMFDGPNLYEKLIALWAEDVFSYFDLEMGTPLQQKAFSKSDAYISLLADLRTQKQFLNNVDFSISDIGELSQYDLKKGAFILRVKFEKNPVAEDKNTCVNKMCNPANQCMIDKCADIRLTEFPNGRYGFYFEQIGGKTNRSAAADWQLKIPEEAAVKIEQLQAQPIVIFSVNKVESRQHNVSNSASKRLPNGYFVGGAGAHKLTLKFIVAKIKRIDFVSTDKQIIYSLEIK